jgi:hypothetical protein
MNVTINYVRRPCHVLVMLLSGMFCSEYLATATFVEDVDKLSQFEQCVMCFQREGTAGPT